MTLGSQITYAERRARVSSNVTTVSSANDVTIQYLNEGVREFAKVVGGIPKTAYLQLSPKFDVQTNWAVRLTVTGGANVIAAADWVLAATNTSSLTAASYATYLGSQLSNNYAVSVSVSWDTTAWKFTLYDEVAAATHVEIGAPSGITYVDGVGLLFNKLGTQATSYFTGNVPMDLNLETDLPSDFLSIESVEWDGSPLKPAPYDLFISPASAGDPTWYAIKNNKIRIAPTPSSQKMFTIAYKAMPDDLATSTATCPLPAAYHFAPIYYASALLAAENHDWTVQQQNYALFINETSKYKIKEANQNSTLFPQSGAYTPIRVEIPSP